MTISIDSRCGVCGTSLDVPDDYPMNETVRSHGMTYEAHAECADIIREEAKQCSPDEHDWPPELDGSECNRCGQPYDTWTVE